MDTYNLYGDEWDEARDREGWRIREAFVGHRLGAELLGASLSEIAPGNRLWPYHTHHGNEEWLIVVRGRPTLRTPSGEQALEEGDVAVFRRGAEGAHQVVNTTDEPVRVLMLSSMLGPEIVEYPDTGKVSLQDARGGHVFFGRLGERVDYWEGE